MSGGKIFGEGEEMRRALIAEITQHDVDDDDQKIITTMRTPASHAVP